MDDFTGRIQMHGKEGTDAAAQTASFMERYEGTGLILKFFRQVFGDGH
jgi:hypothetical protein